MVENELDGLLITFVISGALVQFVFVLECSILSVLLLLLKSKFIRLLKDGLPPLYKRLDVLHFSEVPDKGNRASENRIKKALTFSEIIQTNYFITF